MKEQLLTFEQKIQNDTEFRKKFEAKLREISASGEFATPQEAAVKAIHDLLGLDVTTADLEKAQAQSEELDVEELDQVSGGDYGRWCWEDYACYYVWHHPDESNPDDNCFWDFNCFGIYRCAKVQND